MLDPDDALPYLPSTILLPSRGKLYTIHPKLSDIAGYLLKQNANPVNITTMLLRRSDYDAHDLVLTLLRNLIVKTKAVEDLRAVFDAVNHTSGSTEQRLLST